MIRKAIKDDIPSIVKIYDHIHEQEDSGKVTIGWETGVYPIQATAESALERGDLFVYEDEDGNIPASAIINQAQVDIYAEGKWKYPATDDEVMVLHTLVVDPSASGKGIGRAFVQFYEQYAKENNCHYLRIDTQDKNVNAGYVKKNV